MREDLYLYLDKNATRDYFRNMSEFEKYISFYVRKFYNLPADLIFNTPAKIYEDLPDGAAFSVYAILTGKKEEQVKFTLTNSNGQIRYLRDKR